MAEKKNQYKSLNDAAKTLGADAVFYPGMMFDQFYAGVAEVIAAIPVYVDAKVERRVKAQNHSAKCAK